MGLNLQGTVSLDGSGWESGMKRIESATHHTAEVVKGLVVSAFGIYGIEQAIHKTVEYGEHITDLSRMVGIGIEKLQEFGYAAKLNGLELDELAVILERINKNRLEPTKLPSFQKLGIGTPGNAPVEDIVAQLHLAVKSRSAQEVAGPLMDIGGRSAFKAIPFLKDNLEELAEEAHRVGAIMRNEDSVAFKFIGDQMKTLAQIMVVALAPAILFVFDAIMRMVNGFKGDKAFWETFAKKSSGPLKEFWDAAIGNTAIRNPDDAKKLVNRITGKVSQAFSEAGAESETVLDKLNDAYDRQKAELMSKQKEIEDINRLPDFDSVAKETKEKKGKLEGPSDNLVRVGNFLSSSSNAMERIATEHTALLRRIANNTEGLKQSHTPRIGSGLGHL